jgi:hypothetical protein
MTSITNRTVTKALAVHRDLAIGSGTASQTRGGVTAVERLIELQFVFTTIVEIRALDVTRYTEVLLSNTARQLIRYYYDVTSTATDDGVTVLLPDSTPVAGRWLYDKSSNFTVATLPSPTNIEGTIIYVSDETGGAVLAFSDGTNWRRVTDRVIVS